MVRPKKHLGQHFLTDQNIARKIVAQLEGDFEKVIEVGAGTGVLTRYLLDQFGNELLVIEIDSESIAFLEQHFPALGSNLVEGDFLKTDLKPYGNNLAIIGNFPYNISSQIFFQVLDHRQQVSVVVGMIQKEVAERLNAGPGSKTYGILSVLLQVWYKIDYLFTVNENVFNPPPKVKSAVIRLIRNERKDAGCNEKLLFQLVKSGFNQRRKTLRNSIRAFIHPDIIHNEIFNKRPEQLSVEAFIELTNLIDQNPVESQNS